MSGRKAVEIFKALAGEPVRVRILPPLAEPLVEGTSLFRDDVNFLIDELRLRRAVSLIPVEPDDADEEETTKAERPAAPAVDRRAMRIPAKNKTASEREQLEKKAAELQADIDALSPPKQPRRRPSPAADGRRVIVLARGGRLSPGTPKPSSGERRRVVVLAELVAGASREVAARRAGISARTLDRITADPLFIIELEAARKRRSLTDPSTS